jgi:hypothetical protein
MTADRVPADGDPKTCRLKPVLYPLSPDRLRLNRIALMPIISMGKTLSAIVSKVLFVSQSLERIDLRRSPRRNVACNQSDAN